jgi:hypothetical protein
MTGVGSPTTFSQFPSTEVIVIDNPLLDNANTNILTPNTVTHVLISTALLP